MARKFYIFDFDSTFTQVEALDELARISLQEHPRREEIYRKIEELTNLAMEGKLSFRDSLTQRVQLLEANREHLKLLVKHLKKKVSPSFLRNRSFFKNHTDDVLIVSGGFKEFIIPVVRSYHIKKENVYANTFLFDEQGKIIGYDKDNPLSEEGGKVKLLRQLKLPGEIYGIGDGHSDFQLKEYGMIKTFYAFTENIERKTVAEKADHVTPSFDEFLYLNNLPRAISYPKNRVLCLAVGEVCKEAVQFLKQDGYQVQVRESMEGLDKKESLEVGILLLGKGERLPDGFLEKAGKLKTIGYTGNSQKHLPLDVCTQRGIVVFDDRKRPLSVAKRMVKFMNNGDTYKSTNFPNLQLPQVEDSHRLIHIHNNVPGIMARINQVFAQNQINIVSQFLMTNSLIGYVITDIGIQYDKKLLKELRQIDNTIKFRVLY